MVHASVRLLLPTLVCTASLAALAPAQTVARLARLNAAQEVPTNTSPGTGLGFAAIDVAANTLDYRVLYQNLTSAENAAHIHGFATPGFNAGVLHAQPLGTPKCGTWAMTPAQTLQVLPGNSYFNVHTTVNPGGEIRGQINLAPDQVTFCYGDGSGAACPCANFSAVGDNEGCQHGPGIGGRLVGYAGPPSAPTPSIANDNLVLHALRLPSSTFVLFFQGTTPMAGGNGIPFGAGLLCVTGALTRMNVKATCNGQAGFPEPGDPSISFAGSVTPGTYHYQAWFRVNPPSCSGLAIFDNLTNGVSVTWVP
ncbi:MAG: CHRD domain-containing protein [Planctomycetota bacterium]|mgnify:CR=1 FL=1|nr:CHRD domain-containing protein [Planctomycetota bacterium]